MSILREVGKHDYKLIIEILINSQEMVGVQSKEAESMYMCLVILQNIVTNRIMYLETIGHFTSTFQPSLFCFLSQEAELRHYIGHLVDFGPL